MTRTDLLRLGHAGAKAAAELDAEDAARRAKLNAESGAEFEVLRRQEIAPPAGKKRPWSNAVPTTVPDGVRYASKMEARVAVTLRAECAATGSTLYRQVRLPLLSIAPKRGSPKIDGKPHVFTCDFYVGYVCGGGRYVEAKGTRRSRDYELRKAAAERAFGIVITEVDR